MIAKCFKKAVEMNIGQILVYISYNNDNNYLRFSTSKDTYYKHFVTKAID